MCVRLGPWFFLVRPQSDRGYPQAQHERVVPHVQYLYVPVHSHTSVLCVCVVGVGQQEMNRAWECCAGKLSGKSLFALSQLRPLPTSLKLDFLLRTWSEKTSVLQLLADTHTGIFGLVAPVWSLAKSIDL